MPRETGVFNWPYRYLVRAEDLNTFQDFLLAAIEGLAEGVTGTAVLTGLAPSLSNLDVTISAGIAINEDGRILYLASPEMVTLDSPVGNPARSLVVLRPVDTDAENVTTAVDPTPTALHTIRTAEVVVIDGTPAGSPTYPAIQAGDVILAGFLVPSGASSVGQDDIERYKRDVPRQHESRIRRVEAAYEVTKDDRILEVDNASIDLPADPATVAGCRWTFINMRTSGAVTVDGNGSDLSGQTDLDIDDKYGTLEVYCNGVEYIVI